MARRKRSPFRWLDDCPVCGGRHCISWDSSYAFDEIVYNGNGTVTMLHCIKCEAGIEITIPCKEDEENGE